MATKKYVSLEKLSLYDEKIKQHIADADSAVLQSAKSYADTEVAKANAAADAAQADVDALETYVGTIPEGYSETNVVAYINKKAEETLTSATGGSSESAASVLAALNTYKSENDPKVTANTDAIAAINNTESGILAQAKAYADEGDSGVQADVTELSGKVTTLIGDDTGKSARAISAEEVAKIVAGADESYDTLKEIADWISSHGTDAAAMNSAIVALQAIVDGIGGEGESATVVAYVQSAINALSIGDYAKAADLTALAARVSALETDTHTHANKTVLDGITAEKVSAWDAAEANAKTYADGLNTVMDTRMIAVETWQSEMIEVTEAEINALFA